MTTAESIQKDLKCLTSNYHNKKNAADDAAFFCLKEMINCFDYSFSQRFFSFYFFHKLPQQFYLPSMQTEKRPGK